MKTLPDYLRQDLRIISIGLNPSLASVKAGYYFANPRNRFWKALNMSRLIDSELQPGTAAIQVMFDKYKIGFTDLVKKPTRMAKELRVADFREGAMILNEKIHLFQPGIAWFHGLLTYRYYLKYTEGDTANIKLGQQRHMIGRTRVFVTPNPSPANARYSLDELIRSYNDLVSYQIREAFGLGSL